MFTSLDKRSKHFHFDLCDENCPILNFCIYMLRISAHAEKQHAKCYIHEIVHVANGYIHLDLFSSCILIER